ncbi:hypothetical protein Hamer_G026720 [Homarus americanus]|uniref:Uncharacterized protein n=1 Tax=Homarus americanus TaxID=6706 RepID=A0A8J5J9J2_HOMAM|nr:hypothetical protein Hamer_G026720 [Homarus americanus]
MESWSSVVCLLISEKLFLQANCLSEDLQEGGISRVRAVDFITATKVNLVKMGYDREHEEAEEFAIKFGKVVPEANTQQHEGSARSKRVQLLSNTLKDYQ